MHKEILTKEQSELLPIIKLFNRDFFLVGGTAVALHIGHRESIDYDLFSLKKFGNLSIRRQIEKLIKIDEIIVNKLGEFTIVINEVKMIFFQYPYFIESKEKLDNIIKLPDLLTLASMKVFALGMRAKWKDYVDLYFIIRDHYSIDQIIKQGKKIYKQEFNEKIFRTQLVYFKDIDYREKIVYKKGFAVSDKEIKQKLIEFALKK